MASEADDQSTPSETLEKLNPNKEALDRLSKDFQDLSDKAHQLLTEKLFIENEFAQMKKRASRLEEELSNIKNPPLIVGYVQDYSNEQAIVRSSNGTVFLVSVNRRLDTTKIKPGARVALNQDTLSVVEILSDSWDPLVSNSEMIEAPNVEYSSIGGLDEQISDIREAIELPFENPDAFKEFGIKYKTNNIKNLIAIYSNFRNQIDNSTKYILFLKRHQFLSNVCCINTSRETPS